MASYRWRDYSPVTIGGRLFLSYFWASDYSRVFSRDTIRKLLGADLHVGAYEARS